MHLLFQLKLWFSVCADGQGCLIVSTLKLVSSIALGLLQNSVCSIALVAHYGAVDRSASLAARFDSRLSLDLREGICVQAAMEQSTNASSCELCGTVFESLLSGCSVCNILQDHSFRRVSSTRRCDNAYFRQMKSLIMFVSMNQIVARCCHPQLQTFSGIDLIDFVQRYLIKRKAKFEQSLFVYFICISWRNVLIGNGLMWSRYRSWIRRLIDRSQQCSIGPLLHALLLCRRLTDSSSSQFPFPALHIFAVAMVVSIKFVDGGETIFRGSGRLSNVHFEALLGIPRLYMSQIERWILGQINWRLYADLHEFESLHKSLYQFARLRLGRSGNLRSIQTFRFLREEERLQAHHVFISMNPMSEAFSAPYFFKCALDLHSVWWLGDTSSPYFAGNDICHETAFSMLLQIVPFGLIRIDIMFGRFFLCRRSLIPRMLSMQSLHTYLRSSQMPLLVVMGNCFACPCSAWVSGEGRWKPFHMSPRGEQRTLRLNGEWQIEVVDAISPVM